MTRIDTCRQSKTHTLPLFLAPIYLLSFVVCHTLRTWTPWPHTPAGHFWDVPSLLLERTQDECRPDFSTCQRFEERARLHVSPR